VHPEPIVIPRLAVAVYGGTQPDRLARLKRDGDDGLLGRLLWLWPDPIPFRLGQQTPGAVSGVAALDRLRELDLLPGDPPQPILMPLTAEGRCAIEMFARDMQDGQQRVYGLLRAAYGKARGQTLRLALVLEMLWWCADNGCSAPSNRITSRALRAAIALMDEYFLPMAQRVYAG
jgi:putative DNA primase/helicase